MVIVAMLLALAAQDRQARVLGDKAKIEADGYWIYNDVARGFAEAAKSGKPVLVTFRCIPCAACVQIDSEVAERDARVKALLDQYVCVRVVHGNGMDLSLFQFDYDQSWAAFMLNADRTIYGRYGTRSHQTDEKGDISIAGFAQALEGALELHKDFAKHKPSLLAKRGPPSAVAAPEALPAMKGRYTSSLDWTGKVVQSCIHCHQVGEALRAQARAAGPMPETVLYPYPHPKILGLILDPAKRATVLSVAPGTSAEKDGFKPGDEIVSLDGQPPLSIADVQWILHRAPASGALKASVKRGTSTSDLTLTLGEGWRRKGDIGWRATSWDLRALVFGGMKLKDDLAPEKRKELGLADGALALRIEHVGQYGDHAAAKNAGVKKGDILIGVGDLARAMSESDLLAHLVDATKPGDKVVFKLARGAERLSVTIPMR